MRPAPASSSARSLRSMTSPSRSARFLDSAERCSGDKTATSSKSLSSSVGAAGGGAAGGATGAGAGAGAGGAGTGAGAGGAAAAAVVVVKAAVVVEEGRQRTDDGMLVVGRSIYQAARQGAHGAALLLRVRLIKYEVARGAQLEFAVARLLPED